MHDQPDLLRSCDHRRGLRRLDQLVDHRRRVLAQGHRRPVRLQLRPADRRHHRRRRELRMGGRHHRRLLLRSQGHHPARRAGRADLQHHQSGRRRLHQRYHWHLQRRLLAARVPSGDANEELFDPLLRGRTAASQGDVWWLSWDGNPVLSAGRPHPLGILVEQRGMGWNFPAGNEDILYFIYTFYNVTRQRPRGLCRGPAGHAGHPGRSRATSSRSGTRPRSASTSRTAATPSRTCSPRSAADMDVAEAGANYSSVNVPFALGYVYEPSFSPAPAAGPSTRPSSARRSSPAPASSA